jgi:hypothetical protein
MKRAGNEFEQIVLGTLKGMGWRKRRKTVFFRSGDAILNLNLQKYTWNETIFVNFGIWLLVLGEAEFPKDTDCHLQYRIERVVEDFPEWTDYGDGVTKTAAELEYMKDTVIAKEPELRSFANLEELRKKAAAGLLDRRGLIFKEAREILFPDEKTSQNI